MQILMIGTGYVGLVTGACFAEMGHQVICLDIDEKKIENLQNGIIPIYEPGLEEIVIRNQKAGRLKFTTDYKFGVEHSFACFIAVPTPSGEDGSCNTSYVETAARQIAEQMSNYRLIVNKSTVPVKMGDKVSKIVKEALEKRGIDCEFDVVSNPEFLKEGCAIADCMKPDRVIIGTESQRALDYMKQIYSAFMFNHERMIHMSRSSAELSKYAANAMLATRISFMNELSRVCSSYGANINDIRKGIGSDHRIGQHFLYAGIGYGGSCFPKDIRALINMADRAGSDPILLKAVDETNESQKRLMNSKIYNYFASGSGLRGKTIALWGLSFKPDTDDIRDAPSIELIKFLEEQGAFIRVFDPVAMANTRKIFAESKKITWCTDEADAARGADAVALLTEWKQFRHLDFEAILAKMEGSAFFDGRNQYLKKDMEVLGFDYFGIGIPEEAKEAKLNVAEI